MQNRARPLVTLEGYAVEGGFDRPFEPATCFSPTIALGRHAGPGDAEALWGDYERALDLVVEMGLAGVRLGVEWARIEPRRGRLDGSALERYGQVVRYARGLGLEIDVVLVDAAWPSWLGLEAWLLPWVVPHVLEHARRLVTHLPEITGLVAFADRTRLVNGGYLLDTAPPWRAGASEDAAFARTQIGVIDDALARDPLVGPLLVTSSSTFSLDTTPARVSAWRDATGSVTRLYVRSLMAGRGPSASARGLIERGANGLHVTASNELLEALR